MLIVKETLVKAEELDSVVVHSKDKDAFVALLHGNKERLSFHQWNNWAIEFLNVKLSTICITPFQDVTLSQQGTDLES